MSTNRVRKFDLSDDFFNDTSDDDTPAKFNDTEAPSDGMRALLRSVEEKKERRKNKPKTIAASIFDRSRSEVDAMIETGVWEGVTARHLVALYDLMHFRCYGVACAELGPSERYNAAMMAASMVKREFAGDYADAMEFMRWAWTREIDSETWRRENGRTNARRIGYRLMFSGSLLTDYRLFLARTRK